jgi:hypothetical protein
MTEQQNKNETGGRGNGENRGRGRSRKSEEKTGMFIFTEQMNRGKKRVVGRLMEDPTLPAYKLLQFQADPKSTDGRTARAYECRYYTVTFEDGSGYHQILKPTDTEIKKLSSKEWLMGADLKRKLLQRLYFEMIPNPVTGRPEPTAYTDDGKVVKVDEGSDVKLNEMALYLVRESGNKCFAIHIPTDASAKSSTGMSIVLSQAIEKQVITMDALKWVPIETTTGDVSRNLYELLSGAGVGEVTKDSLDEMFTKALNRLLREAHPERLNGEYGGAKNVPLLAQQNAELLYKSLTRLQESITEILSLRREQQQRANGTWKEPTPKSVVSSGAEIAAAVNKAVARKPRAKRVREIKQADGLQVSMDDEKDDDLNVKAAEHAKLDPEMFLTMPLAFRRRHLAAVKSDLASPLEAARAEQASTQELAATTTEAQQDQSQV